MTEIKVAVLDDYMKVAPSSADWAGLPAHVKIDFVHDKLPEGPARVEALKPYDVLLLMRERTPLPKELLEQLPNLKCICMPNMHNRMLDIGYCVDHGIPVCGSNPRRTPTFEHTWTLILALAKNLLADVEVMRKGGWQTNIGMELKDKTLGVIGLGRIGIEVAAVGRVFGMKVLAWSQNMTPETAEQHGCIHVEKDDLLRQSDVVVVQVIESKRTRGMIGARELGLMKPTAFLVNTARGPIVDEAALIEALREKRIAGAGLDVYAVEPLPADHPFRSMPNVIATPHVAGFTREDYADWYGDMLESLSAWVSGKPIRMVQKGEGFVAVR